MRENSDSMSFGLHVTDSDCETNKNGENFCFPWKASEVGKLGEGDDKWKLTFQKWDT